MKKKNAERHKFTPEEDEIIKDLVSNKGIKKWSDVALHLEKRSPRQCRDRWKNYLSPSIKNSEWSPAEDNLLYSLVVQSGPQFSKISKYFHGRTDVNVKNRWSQLKRYWKRQKETPPMSPMKSLQLSIDNSNNGNIKVHQKKNAPPVFWCPPNFNGGESRLVSSGFVNQNYAKPINQNQQTNVAIIKTDPFVGNNMITQQQQQQQNLFFDFSPLLHLQPPNPIQNQTDFPKSIKNENRGYCCLTAPHAFCPQNSMTFQPSQNNIMQPLIPPQLPPQPQMQLQKKDHYKRAAAIQPSVDVCSDAVLTTSSLESNEIMLLDKSETSPNEEFTPKEMEIKTNERTSTSAVTPAFAENHLFHPKVNKENLPEKEESKSLINFDIDLFNYDDFD